MATFLTTASLAIGVWHVHLDVTTQSVAGGDILIQALAGTATATFEGKMSGEIADPSTANGMGDSGSLDFLATITVAGTLVFQAETPSGANKIKATTNTGAFAKASGYTAVKVG